MVFAPVYSACIMIRRRFIIVILLPTIFVLVAAGFIIHAYAASPASVRFTTLDVGQGDALFFETTSHQQMLIDGGPDNAVLDQLGRVMPFFDRSLDVVVLTHPDSDHVTGLVAVVRRYHIEKFVMTGVVKRTATYALLEAELRKRNVPIQYVHAGNRLDFSDGSAFSVLAPKESWEGKETKQVNNTSIAGKFTYRNFSVLATDDIEQPEEQELLSRNVPLAATILKAPHHGSHTSSSEPFLRAVHPEAVVISVGANNKFGHPHADILARYAAFRLPVFRTDQGGAVTIRSDGEKWTVKQGLLFRLW